MKKSWIDPKLASLAATFYEPVYQRLRLWHQGQAIDLLCFVAAPNDQVKQLLSECDAMLSPTFRAGCFAEVWEVPHDQLVASRFGPEPATFDQAVSQAIGCLGGKYPSTAGLMQWGDNQDQAHNRLHFQSKLLLEAALKRARRR